MSKQINAKMAVSFTQASTIENITSGENISTSFGKLAKWFPNISDIEKLRLDVYGSKNMLELLPGSFGGFSTPNSTTDVYYSTSARILINDGTLYILAGVEEIGQVNNQFEFGMIMSDVVPPTVELIHANVDNEHVQNIQFGAIQSNNILSIPMSEFTGQMVANIYARYSSGGSNVYSYSHNYVLISNELSAGTITINDLNVTYNDNGTITVNGTAARDTYFQISKSGHTVESGVSYTLTGCPSQSAESEEDANYGIDIGITSSQQTNWYFDIGNNVTFIPSELSTYIVSIYIKSGTVCDNLVFKPMLCTTADYTENPEFEKFHDSLYSKIGNINAVLEEVL